MMPSPSMSLPVYLAHYDVDTAQGHDHVGDVPAETHVFQHSEMNEARRTHPVSIGVGCPIADEVEAKLPFGRLDASVGLTGLRSQTAQFCLRIHNRAARDTVDRLLENLQRLAHLQHSQHVAVVNIAVLAEGHAKVET